VGALRGRPAAAKLQRAALPVNDPTRCPRVRVWHFCDVNNGRSSVRNGADCGSAAPERAAEWRVGEWRSPDLSLAKAVGASAAFPPLLSRMKIRIPIGTIRSLPGCDLCSEPYTVRLFLTDGGIYDNLGLEPVWKRYKTILVSDGGLITPPMPRPWCNWLSQAQRVTNISLQQGINMRIRVLRGLDRSGQRSVAYWGIGEAVETYNVENPLRFEAEETKRAANVPTRLTRSPRKPKS
jgi:NTE family protein